MELAATGAPPLAVANYGELPTDVLHDILLRLPADEVCRLRLVCRSWRSLTSDPLFAAAHASRHPHVVVVVSHHEGSHDEAEVRAMDLHGNVIKRRRIRRTDGALGRLSVDGDLLCVSHGWGLACVVDMVTGAIVAVADVTAEHRSTVNAVKPQCVLGHIPSTGEYKVVRIQADYSSSRWQTTCEVMTMGGRGGRWRRRPRPPVSLNIESWSCSGRNMAVVAGFAYFLVHRGLENEPSVEAADSIAVFDLATEEWKPATLQGPLSSRGRRSTDDEEEDDEPMPVLRRKRFQLARLGESLVMLYCNVEDCSTELWFLEDMEDDDNMAARWTRRYTLQRTPFAEEEFFSSLRYHYPLAVLDDGKILVWVDRTFALPYALRVYDPETSAWTDLATPTGGRVVGMHRGSLLCSNLGAP